MPSDSSSLSVLPREVVTTILLHLSPLGIVTASLLNRQFRDIIRESPAIQLKLYRQYYDLDEHSGCAIDEPDDAFVTPSQRLQNIAQTQANVLALQPTVSTFTLPRGQVVQALSGSTFITANTDRYGSQSVTATKRGDKYELCTVRDLEHPQSSRVILVDFAPHLQTMTVSVEHDVVMVADTDLTRLHSIRLSGNEAPAKELVPGGVKTEIGDAQPTRSWKCRTVISRRTALFTAGPFWLEWDWRDGTVLKRGQWSLPTSQTCFTDGDIVYGITMYPPFEKDSGENVSVDPLVTNVYDPAQRHVLLQVPHTPQYMFQETFEAAQEVWPPSTKAEHGPQTLWYNAPYTAGPFNEAEIHLIVSYQQLTTALEAISFFSPSTCSRNRTVILPYDAWVASAKLCILRTDITGVSRSRKGILAMSCPEQRQGPRLSSQRISLVSLSQDALEATGNGALRSISPVQTSVVGIVQLALGVLLLIVYLIPLKTTPDRPLGTQHNTSSTKSSTQLIGRVKLYTAVNEVPLSPSPSGEALFDAIVTDGERYLMQEVSDTDMTVVNLLDFRPSIRTGL